MTTLEIAEKLFGEGQETQWATVFEKEINRKYFKFIKDTLKIERQNYVILPESDKVFRAYKECPLYKTKVVILGQDPYPNRNDACGLAFSVERNAEDIASVPPSLANILEEVEREYPEVIPQDKNPNLSRWAEQGVLLLNTSLTVREGHIASHSRIGWEKLIIATIFALNERRYPKVVVDSSPVYLLWGSHARSFKPWIADRCVILETSHPSPRSVSRGFRGCNHFIKANAALNKEGIIPIKWV